MSLGRSWHTLAARPRTSWSALLNSIVSDDKSDEAQKGLVTIV